MQNNTPYQIRGTDDAMEFLLFIVMKVISLVWKFSKGNLTKEESRDWKGELCHSMSITGRTVNYRPQQKNVNTKWWSITVPQQEKLYIASPSRNPLLHLSQWETVNSCFSLVDFLSKLLPPVHFLFLLEVVFYSFVCWTCHTLHVLNCNSLLFLNKPIFADKIIFTF